MVLLANNKQIMNCAKSELREEHNSFYIDKYTNTRYSVFMKCYSDSIVLYLADTRANTYYANELTPESLHVSHELRDLYIIIQKALNNEPYFAFTILSKTETALHIGIHAVIGGFLNVNFTFMLHR